MTRNCKRGDWAICTGKVKSGTVVRCVAWVGKVDGWKNSDRWMTDKLCTGNKGSETFTYPDKFLRPLHGTFEEIIAQVTAYRLTEMGPK